jgi:thiol-disulfide isomerase/thioredoxin
MKKVLILFLTFTTLMACKQESTIDYVLLSGKVENAIGNTVTVAHASFKQNLILNNDGTFADTLYVAPGYYSISQGRESTTAYLQPGDVLTLNINTAQFDESISYSGIGSEKNNYLANKFLSNEKSIGSFSTFYVNDEDVFTQQVNDLYNHNLTALKTLSDKAFVTIETKNLDYENLELYNRYETYHSHYANKEDFKVSDHFLPKALETLAFDNNTDYDLYESYRNLAMSKIMNDIYDKIGDDYQSASAEQFNVLNTITIPELKNDIIKDNGIFLVSPGNPNMKNLYDFFMSHITDDELKMHLTEKYNKNKDLVMGQPSPEFNDYENHKGGTVSLSDLRGKYVYIDVWATWCGPCRAEIPSLKAIEKEYHGKNIQFVSTSIDVAKDHDKWVDMVKNESLGGLQLFADNNWNSKFVKDYAIEGIPRFILIDPNGNIVSADAPRPSNPKLKTLLEKLKI